VNSTHTIRVHTTVLMSHIGRTFEFEKKGLAQFAVNVGTKCGHDCVYCSTGSTLRMNQSFKDVGEDPFKTGYAIVDPETPDRVADAAKRIKKRGLVQLCTTVDAWSPEAQQYNLGRRCLEALLSEPGWTVRILTKNAAVTKEFDLIEQHRDRVLIGISLTAMPSRADIMSVVEPHASSITDRMAALREARRRGLRVYGMLCPLLPGIANHPTDIDRLISFCLECGAEEIFAEPVNNRGTGLKILTEVLTESNYPEEAKAINEIRVEKKWSAYTTQLLRDIQSNLRSRGALDKLRFLLYPTSLTEEDRQAIQNDDAGVKWLEKEKPPRRGRARRAVESNVKTGQR